MDRIGLVFALAVVPDSIVITKSVDAIKKIVVAVDGLRVVAEVAHRAAASSFVSRPRARTRPGSDAPCRRFWLQACRGAAAVQRDARTRQVLGGSNA